MFTRGSKVFLGLGFAALVAAVIYGIVTNGNATGGTVETLTGDGVMNALLGPITFGYKGGVGEHIGYSLLMGAAISSFGAAVACLSFRDGDAEAVAQLIGTDTAPPVVAPRDLSPWPIVAAVGAAIMVVGLASNSLLFAVGGVVAAIAAIEWLAKAWSEGVSGDPEVNAIARARLMHPIELPVGGLVVIAVLVGCFAKILLSSTKTEAIIVASVVAAIIFAIAVVIGTRPELRRAAVVSAVIAGFVAVLALGIIGAIRGDAPVEHHGEESHASAIVSDYPYGSALGETEAS
ncbi:MAG: hypothetical protein GX868_08915 [Actinobacteria bacterium]|nr:hypothetical protein [Actinomycetota bacterium]